MSFTLPNLVTSCTSRLNKPTDLVRVKNFIAQTPNLGPASEAFKNAIETIETNIRWTDINLSAINKWLTELAPRKLQEQKQLRKAAKSPSNKENINNFLF